MRAEQQLDHAIKAIKQIIELLGREIDDLRREHEQIRRELADLKTTYRDIEVRPIQALPQAPTLVPILGVNEEADTSATCPVDAVAAMVRRTLESIPIGTTVTFATNSLGISLLAGAPVLRGTDAYREVEHWHVVRRVTRRSDCAAKTLSRDGTAPRF